MLRYTVKFNNGFWKVFDNEEYTDYSKERLRKEANQIAETLNKAQ